VYLRPGFYSRQTDSQTREGAWAGGHGEKIDLAQAEVRLLLEHGHIPEKARGIRGFFIPGDFGEDRGVAQESRASRSGACIYGKNQHLAILAHAGADTSREK
jgi:hypothetical protein